MKSMIIIFVFLMLVGSLAAQVEVQIESDTEQYEEFITAQIAMINSIGEFRESWVGANAFYLGYGKIYPGNWALVMQTGYMTFKNNENVEFDDGASFDVIPLMVGGRYYIFLDKIRPFLLAMNGINIITEKWTQGDVKKDHTVARFNFQVGIGLSIVMMEKLEIEISGKYNSHLLEPSVPYNMTGMEVGLALNWRL